MCVFFVVFIYISNLQHQDIVSIESLTSVVKLNHAYLNHEIQVSCYVYVHMLWHSQIEVPTNIVHFRKIRK